MIFLVLLQGLVLSCLLKTVNPHNFLMNLIIIGFFCVIQVLTYAIGREDGGKIRVKPVQNTLFKLPAFNKMVVGRPHTPNTNVTSGPINRIKEYGPYVVYWFPERDWDLPPGMSRAKSKTFPDLHEARLFHLEMLEKGEDVLEPELL